MSEWEIDRLKEEVEESALIEKEQRFSPAKFLVGIAKLITSFSFIAYGVYTFLVASIIFRAFTMTNGELISFLGSVTIIIMAAGWVLSTVIVVAHLQKAFDAMIRKIEIKANADIKAGFNKNLELKGEADVSKIAETVINAAKGS